MQNLRVYIMIRRAKFNRRRGRDSEPSLASDTSLETTWKSTESPDQWERKVGEYCNRDRNTHAAELECYKAQPGAWVHAEQWPHAQHDISASQCDWGTQWLPRTDPSGRGCGSRGRVADRHWNELLLQTNGPSWWDPRCSTVRILAAFAHQILQEACSAADWESAYLVLQNHHLQRWPDPVWSTGNPLLWMQPPLGHHVDHSIRWCNRLPYSKRSNRSSTLHSYLCSIVCTYFLYGSAELRMDLLYCSRTSLSLWVLRRRSLLLRYSVKYRGKSPKCCLSEGNHQRPLIWNF